MSNHQALAKRTPLTSLEIEVRTDCVGHPITGPERSIRAKELIEALHRDAIEALPASMTVYGWQPTGRPMLLTWTLNREATERHAVDKGGEVFVVDIRREDVCATHGDDVVLWVAPTDVGAVYRGDK